MLTTKRKPATVGEILTEEFMQPMGLTQGALAEAMGVHLVWSNVHVHLAEAVPDKGVAVLQLAEEIGVEGRGRPCHARQERLGPPVGEAEPLPAEGCEIARLGRVGCDEQRLRQQRRQQRRRKRDDRYQRRQQHLRRYRRGGVRRARRAGIR